MNVQANRFWVGPLLDKRLIISFLLIAMAQLVDVTTTALSVHFFPGTLREANPIMAFALTHNEALTYLFKLTIPTTIVWIFFCFGCKKGGKFKNIALVGSLPIVIASAFGGVLNISNLLFLAWR